MRIITINGRMNVRASADQLPQPYERFSITLNPDASRTLRALTVSPNGGLVRDVNVHVTRDWVSMSGSSRVFIDGVLQGTVAKYAHDDQITSVVWTGAGAPDIQAFPKPERYSLGFHPLADEAWKMAHIAPETGRRQRLTTHTCSPRWNGKTIEHGATVESEVEYLGEEVIPVAGKPERCRIYLWYTPFGRLLKVWVLGEHNIFARLEVIEAPNAGTIYDIASLEYDAW